MNGAVFQVSAMMTDSTDCQPSVDHRIWVPSKSLAIPSAWKIHFHSSAETTVGIAHGTRMLARTMLRPLNALCITRAIATPKVVSRSTQVTVKNVVL
jgi:hypothetical protein